MAEELQDIFDKLVTLQTAITPPSGEKALKATDELPDSFGTFPIMINVEEHTEIDQGPSRRQQKHTINMHLLFAAASAKYSMRARRRWVKAVMDKFDTNLRLELQCHYARIASIDYEPVTFGETPYVAATFELIALVDGAFAYAS